MDEAELQQIMNQKKENPRLIRKPLNLGSKFISMTGSTSEAIIPQILTQYNVVLLLFGAGWCNITKPFIKELKKHYEQINLQKKNLQIVFVSFDKIREDFDEVVKQMPWLIIPFEDQRVKDLKEFYNVRAMPELVLISNEGEIVSKNCRKDVYELGEDQAYEKWVAQKGDFVFPVNQ